ncbi:hypothetical protein SR1949_53410 [Sphaerospermopsis reniformis]|uniref:Uncharacterized protein n=1 Tax=Sphaerospermopsis reniformis TaxID=531300 RepID=A0A480A5L0_9CYAN|nr:DUF2281 domain-containing protein [Sphaerospermopsis reniformis]GCL40207.1 hypothetical protein SR1949_53410 [Sphaerospermopsis reniformis]
MDIKLAEISQEINSLPEEAQILLLDFIQILKKHYPQPKRENTITSQPHPLNTFIEKYGAWEDERTAEEIVKEIYDSRTISHSDISL